MANDLNIAGAKVTKLERIPTDGGYVMHGLSREESTFCGFGEVYFSCIEAGKVRGWKKHRNMTLNLVVLIGKIRFVLIDGRGKYDPSNTDEVVLSPEENYARLTVPPGVWVAFQGIDCQKNMLVNVANIKHHPAEADQVPLNNFDFVW